MEPDRTDELLELLGAAWDGDLDETSFARLEQLLTEQGDRACDLLVDFSQLQVELAWLAASSVAHERALSTLQARFSDESAAGPASRTLVVGRRSPAMTVRPVRRRTLALAAVVLVPLVALCWMASNRSPNIAPVAQRIHLVRAPYKVARLVEARNAKWSDGVERQPGDLFSQEDRLFLQQGSAQISMSFGADVLLQAPCSVEFVSASRLRLENGKLTAQVASWAKGFVVDADGMRVTDLGTRFAVSAESSGEAEAHVLDGTVRVESLGAVSNASQPAVTLKAGQAVRWRRSDRKLQSIPADPSQFASTLPAFHPLRLIDTADTGRGLPVGARDARWRITAGHVSGGSFPAQAVVGIAQPYYMEEASSPNLPSGVRGNSQWVSVRNGITRGVAPHAAFTFETSFDLTGFDPETVYLMGQVLVDNRVQEVRLNGKALAIQPFEIFRIEDFQRFHVIELAEGFVDGVNRIEFDVINGSVIDGADNPMALRVEWQGFGRVGG